MSVREKNDGKGATDTGLRDIPVKYVDLIWILIQTNFKNNNNHLKNSGNLKAEHYCDSKDFFLGVIKALKYIWIKHNMKDLLQTGSGKNMDKNKLALKAEALDLYFHVWHLLGDGNKTSDGKDHVWMLTILVQTQSFSKFTYEVISAHSTGN